MRVLVVGSLNMDATLHVDNLPAPGETLLARHLTASPGGKGANQALALARMGLDVAMLGRVGDDANGAALTAALGAAGVDVSLLTATPGTPTGVAHITVDSQGRNTIIVASGANFALSPADIDAALPALSAARAVLLQLEIPLETVRHTLGAARAKGCLTVLNPAPFHPLDEGLLELVDVCIPNEVEFARCTGADPATGQGLREGCARLARRPDALVVVTLGSRGCWVYGRGEGHHLPAYEVTAVDSTAAGDSFIGGFLATYLQGGDPVAAADAGQRVAALTVSRQGAAASIPTLDEVAAARLTRRA